VPLERLALNPTQAALGDLLARAPDVRWASLRPRTTERAGGPLWKNRVEVPNSIRKCPVVPAEHRVSRASLAPSAMLPSYDREPSADAETRAFQA